MTLVAVLATAAGIGGLVGPGAFAKPISQAPPGNLTANPSSAAAGSTVSEVFRFTAKAPVTALGTTLTINRAPDWSVFQTASKGLPGYVALDKGTCTNTGMTAGASAIVVTGVKCAKSNQFIQVSYFNAVAPTTVVTSAFTALLSTAPSTLMPANINVVAASVATVAWLVYPSNASAGSSITPAPQVLARDAFNNPASTTVNLALGAATPVTTGVLSGTTGHSTVAGIATFPGLKVNKVGTLYTLVASAGAAAAVPSIPFNITPGAPTSMVLGLAPSTINADGLMPTLAKATVTDANGNGVPGLAITIARNILDDVGVGSTIDNGDGTYTAPLTASITAGLNTIIASCAFICGPLTTQTAPLTELAAGNWFGAGYGTSLAILSNYGTCCFGVENPPIDLTVPALLPAGLTYATTGATGFALTGMTDPASEMLGPLGVVNNNGYMWYSPTSFDTTLTFDNTWAGVHTLRIYASDFNNAARDESILVNSLNSGGLGSVNFTNFQHGAWFTVPFTVGPAGDILTITALNNIGPNAVISGVFVD
jgi:hypothetical protein